MYGCARARTGHWHAAGLQGFQRWSARCAATAAGRWRTQAPRTPDRHSAGWLPLGGVQCSGWCPPMRQGLAAQGRRPARCTLQPAPPAGMGYSGQRQRTGRRLPQWDGHSAHPESLCLLALPAARIDARLLRPLVPHPPACILRRYLSTTLWAGLQTASQSMSRGRATLWLRSLYLVRVVVVLRTTPSRH